MATGINNGVLISVVGNAGVGKTTLARLLSEKSGAVLCLEEHAERPFQRRFMDDHAHALPNQMDYLLLRAEQELHVRQNRLLAVQDGGLDLDFHGFTRLFLLKGYLSQEEYALCGRLHALIRATLPPPDLIIRLSAPIYVIVERRRQRGRTLDVAASEDVAVMESLISDWLDTYPAPDRVLELDVTERDMLFSAHMDGLLARIEQLVEAAGW